MWLYESKLRSGQFLSMDAAPSPRLPQTHIALLVTESTVQLPNNVLALVVVLGGNCVVESDEGACRVAARRFIVCDRKTHATVHLQVRGLALVLCFSEAAKRWLLPDADGEPLPGDGALDRETVHGICSMLRTAEAPTTQFWLRESAVRSLLRRISVLQANLFDRMTLCPGKTIARKQQVMTRMQRARRYLETHADRNVRISELAQLTCYSHCYFTKTFQRIYGQSPKACATGFRLERACRMLRNATHSAESVGQIAVACGFYNQSAFSRAFRQHFGTSATFARSH